MKTAAVAFMLGWSLFIMFGGPALRWRSLPDCTFEAFAWACAAGFFCGVFGFFCEQIALSLRKVRRP